MILKAEDDRVVKVVGRDNGWVSVEVMWLNKAGEWKHKQVTLMVSEVAMIHRYVQEGETP